MRMAAMAVMSSTPILSPLQRVVFSITQRSRVCLHQGLLFFPVKSVESREDGLHYFRVVPSAMLTAVKKEVMVPEAVFAAEKEAVKDVLTLFLRKRGLTNAAARRTVRKSSCFIDHLVSRLHTIDKTRYLVGSELPVLALEIKNVLVPYLESLLEKHRYILVDVLQHFPDPPPEKERSILDMELLPSDIRYLIDDVGMDREQIERLIREVPGFLDYGLLGKIKPLVEFFLDLDLSRSRIFTIISEMPYVFQSLSLDMIPTLFYMESLGLDKKRWGDVISQSPGVLKFSHHKVKEVTEFFLSKGYRIQDIAVMASLNPNLFGISLRNLNSKFDFFLTLDYPKSELVYYPNYFRYSLERRIKPRFAQLRERGLRFTLSTVISRSEDLFEKSVNPDRDIDNV